MSDLEYVALAYGVIWVGLLAYLIRLSLRQEGLRSEMRFVEQMLRDRRPATGQDDEEIGTSFR